MGSLLVTSKAGKGKDSQEKPIQRLIAPGLQRETVEPVVVAVYNLFSCFFSRCGKSGF